jgi:hypothetical protein
MMRAWIYTTAALLIAGAQSGAAQNAHVTDTYEVGAASPGHASCAVLKDMEQVRALLTDAGYSDEDFQDLDKTKPLLWVTAADHHSTPGTLYRSKDGSQTLIDFDPSSARHIGGFLLVVDGSLGWKNSCGISRPVSEPTAANTTDSSFSLSSAQADQPAAQTTRTSTSTGSATSAKPQ